MDTEREEGHPPPENAEGALWAGCIRESRIGDPRDLECSRKPADQATSDRGMLLNWEEPSLPRANCCSCCCRVA